MGKEKQLINTESIATQKNIQLLSIFLNERTPNLFLASWNTADFAKEILDVLGKTNDEIIVYFINKQKLFEAEAIIDKLFSKKAKVHREKYYSLIYEKACDILRERCVNNEVHMPLIRYVSQIFHNNFVKVDNQILFLANLHRFCIELLEMQNRCADISTIEIVRSFGENWARPKFEMTVPSKLIKEKTYGTKQKDIPFTKMIESSEMLLPKWESLRDNERLSIFYDETKKCVIIKPNKDITYYEICWEPVSKKLFDRLASLDSFLGKRIKWTNRKVTYVSSDTGESPEDAIKCSLDDNLNNKERCYIIPSTLHDDEIDCLRVSWSNELISFIYPKDSLMGKDISLVEIENAQKTLIDLYTLEKVEMKVHWTDYIITNIDIVTNRYASIIITWKKYSRIKTDNDKCLFLDPLDLKPITYNWTNDYMRHDEFRRISLWWKKMLILKNNNSTIFVDIETWSKIEPKIAWTNDKITDFEFYMYREPSRRDVIFKAKINDDKRVVIDQESKITNIAPDSLQRPQEISLKDRIKLLETGWDNHNKIKLNKSLK